MVVITSVDSTMYSAPALHYRYWWDFVPKKQMQALVDDSLFNLSLDYVIELAVGGIIWKLADHFIEVKERVTGSHNFHFVSLKQPYVLGFQYSQIYSL